MLIKLKKLCEENNLEFKECTEYHWQIKGKHLVNYYPTKETVYIKGMAKKIKNVTDIEYVINLALGDSNINKKDTTIIKRKNSYKEKKERLISRGYYKCWICGESPNIEELTIDHVIPISKGGSNRYDNLKLACKKCNEKKADNL